MRSKDGSSAETGEEAEFMDTISRRSIGVVGGLINIPF